MTESALRSGKADDLAVVRATLPASAARTSGWTSNRRPPGCAAPTTCAWPWAPANIRDDTEPPEEITGEEDQQLAVYYWLTAMQGSLVDALVDARSGRS